MYKRQIIGILPVTNTNLREVDNNELRAVMDMNVAAFSMFAEFPGVNIIKDSCDAQLELEQGFSRTLT